MDKKDVIAFFDRCAPTWDSEMVKNDRIIESILDNAEIGSGMDILDVACGTGVMIPYYLARGAASVTGVDISPEMAKLAGEKFADREQVRIVCADVEEAVFDRRFDAVVVYNAFPHFPEPKRLIKTLASLLKEGGRLTIAHGASREAIDGHHQGSASAVSCGLMSAQSLKALFDPWLQVEVVISNDRMYQVSGVKRDKPAHTHSHGETGQGSGMEELLALMQFMISHNDAHAQELTELASRLHEGGKKRAYQRIMEAVADFDMANAQLDAVLRDLREEQELPETM